MSLRKDKEKVLGENFDDDRIKAFLDIKPCADLNPDFHVLEKAYRGMNVENFSTFIRFFMEAGRNINATDQEGKTILELIQHHRHAKDYVKELQKAGAK